MASPLRSATQQQDNNNTYSIQEEGKLSTGSTCLLEAEEAAAARGAAAQPASRGLVADVHQGSHEAVLPGRPQCSPALHVRCEV